MALTGTSRGQGSTNTAGQNTLVVTPSGNLAAGSMAVLVAAYDNSQTSPAGGDPFSAITDSVGGNTWTSRQASVNDPGAANAGVALRIFTCLLVNGITTSDTITVSFSGITTVARAWALHEVTAGAGNTPIYVTGNQGTGSSTTPSITSTSIGSGNMIIGGMGAEGNAAITADSDSTNGSWSVQQTSGIGTTTGGVEVASQRKITTSAGAQTYNLTITTADWCIAWIEIREAITFADPFTDSVGATDSSTQAATLTPSISGATTPLDSPSPALTASPSISDATTPSDSLTPAATLIPSLSDSSPVTDGVSAGILFTDPFTDSLTPLDSFSSDAIFSPSVSDSVLAADGNAALATFLPSTTDSLSSSDSLSPAATFAPSVSDNVQIKEADPPPTATTFVTTLSDSQVLADSISITSNFLPSITDSISSLDTPAPEAVCFASTTDSSSVTDSSAIATTFNLSFTDSFSSIDSASSTLGGGILFDDSFTDSLTMNSFSSALLSCSPVMQDNVLLGDAASSALIGIFSESIFESITLIDNLILRRFSQNASSEAVVTDPSRSHLTSSPSRTNLVTDDRSSTVSAR